jgi:hypothetical protein
MRVPIFRYFLLMFSRSKAVLFGSSSIVSEPLPFTLIKGKFSSSMEKDKIRKGNFRKRIKKVHKR